METVFVAPAHLLIGLLNCHSQIVSDILHHFDVDREAIKQQVIDYLRDDNPDMMKQTSIPIPQIAQPTTKTMQSIMDWVGHLFGLKHDKPKRDD